MRDNCLIPPKLLLNGATERGIFLGGMNQFVSGYYIGMQLGADGNIMIMGGNGAGKSSGIVKPTITTWGGAVCAIDLKGELTEFYQKFSDASFQTGTSTRPYIVFDPMCRDGPSYDPFWWPLKDSEDNLVKNIWEIALAIIPIRPGDPQPFWDESERGVLAAALLYFYQLELSFSEAVCEIMKNPLSQLCTELAQRDDNLVKMFLGQLAEQEKTDSKVIANVDRGLRNKLMLFATDQNISHAFRGAREGAECFHWDDLDKYNIFLRIPEDRIEQWGGAITLMYTQLFRYLERRPEKYTAAGASNIPTLLLMDEFPRLGQMSSITTAISTLRSKNVNICLVVQSIAQLDQLYGTCGRRIIMDNCQYQVILRANDPETQKNLCDLIGTHTSIQHSASEHLDSDAGTSGYSRAISETRDWIVHPHELASLDDVLLLTPQGNFRIEKLRPCSVQEQQLLCMNAHRRPSFSGEAGCVSINDPIDFSIFERSAKMNMGAKKLSISQRTENAGKRVKIGQQQQRLAEKQAREAQEKKDQHRYYIIGELVTKYFPEVRNIEPGNNEENESRFGLLEGFLSVLSADQELVQQLKARAHSEDLDGWDHTQCVDGHDGESV